jgi:hypothetical protein
MLVKDFTHLESQDKLALYHMKSEYNAKENYLKFLYKFELGVTP